MLETKIEELTRKLDEVNATLQALVVTITTAPVAAKVDPTDDLPVVGKLAEKIEKIAEEHEVKVADVVSEPSEPEKAISRDELQELCMTIVRADRSKKATIKDLICSFGGAKTLKEVPDSDLPALKTKLEGLK